MPTGKELLGQLTMNAIKTREIEKMLFPIELLFNVDPIKVAGDKVTMKGIKVPTVEVTGETVADCAGIKPVCVDSSEYSFEIKHYYAKNYIFDKCRLSEIEAVMNDSVNGGIEKATAMLEMFRKEVMEETEYAKIKQTYKETMPKLTVSTETEPKLLDRLILDLAKLKDLNPRVNITDYVVVVRESVLIKYRKELLGCADFQLGLETNIDLKNPLGTAMVMGVPAEFLMNGATQMDYAIYARPVIGVYSVCEDNYFHEMTNDHAGKIALLNAGKWGVGFSENNDDILKTIGMAGKI